VSEPAGALPRGHCIGVFQVQGFLGAGGMGEVYRARDTKLERDVALKILPSAFSADVDRLARFQREARVLAALNHPHVAAIHGLEEAAGVRAIVLELIEGETLADRLRGGPLPLTEALTVARQIADALDATHEKGIVHRDLKPANIKITPAGTVKVLDFGLAKETAQPAEQAELSHSPTMSFGPTGTGVLLGTAPYMSPEQARGRPVDGRTDIWAFGCVLYEMLTGRPAFPGATISDTIAAILDREPAWDRLPKPTPSNVRRLLRRCLQKDLRRRLQHIGDARLELEEPDAAAPPEETRSQAAKSRARRLWPWTATIAALAAVALWAFRTPSTSNQSLLAAAPEPLTFDSGFTAMPALSADGRLLAYASDRSGHGDLDIWVQQMAGGVPLRLTDDPADDREPDFSPDGSQIAFRSDRSGGGVYVVPTLGGTPRLLAPEGREPRFSPDGTRLAYWTGSWRGSPAGLASAVHVLSLAGGAPVRLLEAFAVAHSVVWAPDGRSLLALGRTDTKSPLAQGFDWWRVPLDGAAPTRTGLLDVPGFRDSARRGAMDLGAWTPSGVLLSEGASLWLIPFSPATGRVSVAGRRLTLGTGAYADPKVSQEGHIVFAAYRTERVVERVPLSGDSEAPSVRLYSDSRVKFGRASVTRDGSVVVFERASPGHVEIWRKDVRTGEQRMIVPLEGVRGSVSATVSQDGARVGYTLAGEAGEETVQGMGYVVEVDGGLPRRICDRCGVYGFLTNHDRVVVTAGDSSIRILDMRSGHELDVIVDGQGRVDRPSPSPDGRWMAFRRKGGTGGKVHVAPILSARGSPESTWALIEEPTSTGRPCGWSPDSRVLYLLLDTDGFRCLWGQRIDPGSGHPVGRPYAVRHFHRAGVAFGTSLGNAIAADGFVYEGITRASNIWGVATGAAGSAP
jgi:eukaryotic-like serine/threonine-protein kinase